MGKLKTQLPAFTLVETIVSLLLISMALGIALLLFNQVATEQNLEQKAALMADQFWVALERGERQLENQNMTSEFL